MLNGSNTLIKAIKKYPSKIRVEKPGAIMGVCGNTLVVWSPFNCLKMKIDFCFVFPYPEIAAVRYSAHIPR
jgi:hypothetical protein